MNLLIKPILLACGLSVIGMGCTNPESVSRTSTTNGKLKGDESADARLRITGHSSESSEGRYVIEFKNDRPEDLQIETRMTCRAMEYQWNGNVVSVKEGELRINDVLQAELEFGDRISIDDAGIVLVNGKTVWRTETE